MNKKTVKKKITAVIYEALGLILFAFILFNIQSKRTLAEQTASMKNEIDQIKNSIADSDEAWEKTVESYDEVLFSKASTMAYFVNYSEDFSYLDMEYYRKMLDVGNVLIVSKEGIVKAKAKDTQADFKAAAFNSLYECFKHEYRHDPFTMNYLNGESYTYYACRINARNMVVIEEKPDNISQFTSNFSEWEGLLKNVSVGNNGIVMVINSNTYNIIYSSDSKYTGKDAISLDLEVDNLADGYFGWMIFDYHVYYTGVTYSGGDFVLCMIPIFGVYSATWFAVVVIMIVFTIVITLMLAYALFIDNDGNSKENRYRCPKFLKGRFYFDVFMARKLSSIYFVGLILIFAVSVYSAVLLSLTNYSISNSQRMSVIEKYLVEMDDDDGSTVKIYEEFMKSQGRIASKIISGKEILDLEQLQLLSDDLGVIYVEIFNKNGKVISSNANNIGYELSKKETNPFFECWELLDGNGVLIIDAVENDLTGERLQYVGSTIYDADGKINGFVLLATDPEERENLLAGASVDSILNSVVSDNNSIGFAIDAETQRFSYFPEKKLKNRKATEYGITEKELKDGYNGYITLQGEKYYANVILHENNYLFIATKIDNLFSNIIMVSLKSLLVSAAILAVVFLFICTGRNEENEDGSEKRTASYNGNTFSDMLIGYHTVSSKWNEEDSKWSEKTPEQKVFALLYDIFALLTIFIAIATVILKNFGNDYSILVYILEGDWEKGLNVFSLTASLLAASLGFLVSAFLRKILDILNNNLGARGVTICRMLKGAVKYIIGIIVLYYCFRLFGVDPKTLLASAGVMSVVIGLGANTLMSDILAGIFLIFEGSFRVGDIVKIEDWRGVVLDIGIRTTKIEDDYHNIKIISNSKVSGIINMTQKLTLAVVDVGTDYGESLERIEAVLSKEFPGIKERLPKIINGPIYRKVDSLGDSAVVLSIGVECQEIDRLQLERDLKREIKLIFDKNNINIPFNQVVLNQPVDYSQRVSVSEQNEARIFNEQQDELNEDLINSMIVKEEQ